MGRRLPMRPKLLLKLKLLRLPKLSELPPSKPLLIKLPPIRPPLNRLLPIKLPPSRLLLRRRQIAR